MAVQSVPLAPEADPRAARAVVTLNAPDPKAAEAQGDIAAALDAMAKAEAKERGEEPEADPSPELIDDGAGDEKKKAATKDAKVKPAESTAAKKLKDDAAPERDTDGKFVAKGGTAEGEADRDPKAATETKPKDEPEKPSRKAEQFAKKAEDDRKAQRHAAKLKADADAAAADRAQAAKDRAEAAADKERLAKLKADPMALLAHLEIDDDASIDRILRAKIAGKKTVEQTPEEKIAAAAEARVQALFAERDAKVETEQKAKREADEKAHAAEGERRVRHQLGEAHALLEADGGDKYQALHLFEIGPDAIVRAHYHLHQNGSEMHGVPPGAIVPLAKVAEMLETEFSATLRERSKKAQRLLASLLPAANEPQVRHQSPGESVRHAAPNAISQRKAAQIVTPSDERADLSDDERIREAAKLMTYSHD